ncbi:hypothetical protein EB73_03445 [Mycobacterium sp. SWH-M3]|nr:hypothetical protein EB73_03445 [Mycobacterium sp. SWH-M3]
MTETTTTPTHVHAGVLAGHSVDADVPSVDDVAAQGDVLVSVAKVKRARTPLTEPVVIVEAGFGGNPHTLHPDGECFWDPEPVEGLKLGVLTVPKGSKAFLFHAERPTDADHGGLEILPGTYRVSRQREYAGEYWAMVAD